MTEPLFRCSGCGAELTPDRARPLPFRCPAADGDAVDHVLVRVRPAGVAMLAGPEEQPFLRYRSLSASYALARREGLSDEAYVALVRRLDDAVAGVEGHGFTRTPLARQEALARAVGAPGLALWVKDETGNVSGSHKARHLFGILVFLEVARATGLLTGPLPRLAIASCGNAALAAAVVARAAGIPLDVFVPPDANARVVDRLASLGSQRTVCARTPASPAGDPCYHSFRAAVGAGALPFCCQGGDNGLAIDGGETLGLELAEGAPALDALFVQVGGGALASSVIQGLRLARDAGALRTLPRIYAVQTQGAAPLARAWERVATHLGADPSAPPAERAAKLRTIDPRRRDEALAFAATHRASFMWPWEEAPHSIAHGILDDETYDWVEVVRGMLESGGHPLVVDEATLLRANKLGREATGIPVDPTGTSGLAGLLSLLAEQPQLVGASAGVIFSGRDRDAG